MTISANFLILLWNLTSAAVRAVSANVIIFSVAFTTSPALSSGMPVISLTCNTATAFGKVLITDKVSDKTIL